MMVRAHEKINSYSLEELYNLLKSYEYDVLDEVGDQPNADSLAFVSKTETDDTIEADDEGEDSEESDAKALYSNNNKFFQKRPPNKTNFNRYSNNGKQPTKPTDNSNPKSETTPPPEKKLLGDSGYDCNYCFGKNHLAKDCMLKKANEKKERIKDEAYYTKKLEEVRANTQSLSLIVPNNSDGTYQIWSSGSDDDEIRKPTHGAMFATQTGHGIWSDDENSDEEKETKITGVCLMAQGTNHSSEARLTIPEQVSLLLQNFHVPEELFINDLNEITSDCLHMNQLLVSANSDACQAKEEVISLKGKLEGMRGALEKSQQRIGILEESRDQYT
ncbi:hypothetical protein L1887_02295 [Cichorium endivia]|nr:hypothetical protein L1887_02295 [Cichorium endivia]